MPVTENFYSSTFHSKLRAIAAKGYKKISSLSQPARVLILCKYMQLKSPAVFFETCTIFLLREQKMLR